MSIDATVLAKLRDQAKRSGGVATAQVFLFPTETDVNEAARQIVDEVSSMTPKTVLSSIGRISPLAKSFSLTAEPGIFEALANNPRVKSILPSLGSNIYPRWRPSRGKYEPS
jgi:hypothetical protein